MYQSPTGALVEDEISCCPLAMKHSLRENSLFIDHIPSWKPPFWLGMFLAMFDQQRIHIFGRVKECGATWKGWPMLDVSQFGSTKIVCAKSSRLKRSSPFATEIEALKPANCCRNRPFQDFFSGFIATIPTLAVDPLFCTILSLAKWWARAKFDITVAEMYCHFFSHSMWISTVWASLEYGHAQDCGIVAC
jgi:hypothetical protein